MKTLNPQDSNSHVLISEELQGRIDTEQLFKKSFASNGELSQPDAKNQDEDDAYPDQVTLIFKDLPFPCVYSLAAWQSDSVTIIVPPSHLSRFFDLQRSFADMIIFDNNFLCVDSFARKKDGEWFVTIFVRS